MASLPLEIHMRMPQFPKLVNIIYVIVIKIHRLSVFKCNYLLLRNEAEKLSEQSQ